MHPACLQVRGFKISYRLHPGTHALHIDMYGTMHFTFFGRNAFHSPPRICLIYKKALPAISELLYFIGSFLHRLFRIVQSTLDATIRSRLLVLDFLFFLNDAVNKSYNAPSAQHYSRLITPSYSPARSRVSIRHYYLFYCIIIARHFFLSFFSSFILPFEFSFARHVCQTVLSWNFITTKCYFTS